MIDPQEFRNALGRFASGVTVVTMMDGDEPHGITVSAFMSISLAPPLVAVSIGCKARAHGLLGLGRHFGVSVLGQDQAEVSDMFAGRPVRLKNPIHLTDGFPFIRNSVARLLCRTTASHRAGDHTIFVGEVERLAYGEGSPLIYHRGSYTAVEEFDLID